MTSRQLPQGAELSGYGHHTMPPVRAAARAWSGLGLGLFRDGLVCPGFPESAVR